MSLLVVCVGVGILLWPFLLKLGLSIPLLLQGKWNSGVFVWTVPQMRGTTAGSLLSLWGGIDGAIYFGIFSAYRNDLRLLRRRWIFSYKWFFPTAKEWMPDELARHTRWAVIFTLAHAITAAITLLLVAAGTSYIAVNNFRMSFQYSHQLQWLMFTSIAAWAVVAHPCLGVLGLQGLICRICSYFHLTEDIQYARDNVALHQERYYTVDDDR
jgi:hypothetical protein